MPATQHSRPLRASLYLRLSVASDDESTSIERQERDLRRLAAAEGWDVVSVLIDDGMSGRAARVKATAAVEALRSGDIDVLAVWKFDRFSREGVRGLVPLLDALDSRPESTFVALQDGLRSGTSAWDMLAPILATFARSESNNTAIRVRSAIASNRAAGRWTGGPAPVGYASAPNPDGPGRVLIPATDEVRYLVEAARRIVAGESVYAVTAYMNSTPFRPRRAPSWSLQAVKQSLTGSAIVGRVTIKGEVMRDADGMPRQVWEPALPVDLWREVRAVLAARAESSKPAGTRARSARSRLLSGVAVCASCGAPLYVRQQQNGTPAYRCASRSNGRPCAGAASVTAERLEEFVVREFLSAVGRLAVVHPVEVEPVAAALAEAEEALQHLGSRLGNADLDDADEEALLAQRSTLRARVRALRAEATATPPEVQFHETGETYAEVWSRLADTSSRRDHLMTALDYVAVHPGVRGRTGPLDRARVEVRWRGETDQANNHDDYNAA
ncbi:recombinase family protein [Cellulomonas dongxiuzhuiae]|uniref:Recombinase family protein n=1 Tax=Cellulomonas dongxiuzhuiae TaxID=2819979 RepID=A0ABX8GMK2_9CELL|nr:recombinase family protein [Cellulomonas dongxiuzhuiae]MBO3095857.1 recombinase family protein [Cellulomonas dongxiuzhuiae]QWC17163.1 recombinase family protein [Cellulomonas dongxiuzhuiae]